MPFFCGAVHDLVTGRSWTREQFECEILSRAACYRGLNVGRGDRVLLVADNTLEFFAGLLGVWQCGAAAVPADPALSGFELDNLVAAAEPKLIVWTGSGSGPRNSSARVVSVLDKAAEIDSLPSSSLVNDDDALILFTSGSTGQPKGVVHTHRSLLAQWTSLRQTLGLGAYRRTLCLLPVHFGHGLICNCLFPLLSGCDLYLGPAFQPSALSQLGPWIDKHEITAMSSVPSLWRLALRLSNGPEHRSLQRIHVGSAPLGADLWGRIGEWAPGAEVVNTYGITETASWLGGSLGCAAQEDGLIGHGWSAQIRILRSADPATAFSTGSACPAGETGYVWVRTPALMKGYFRRDDLTEKVVSGGWFFTGDIGYLDLHSRLNLAGRASDEINKGGLKVQPQDVELVAASYDNVADVCVFSVPDELYGQNIGIAFVLNDSRAEALRGLRAWMQSRLSRHKMPSLWYSLESMPRTARGKIQRSAIADLCSRQEPLKWESLPR